MGLRARDPSHLQPRTAAAHRSQPATPVAPPRQPAADGTPPRRLRVREPDWQMQAAADEASRAARIAAEQRQWIERWLVRGAPPAMPVGGADGGAARAAVVAALTEVLSRAMDAISVRAFF